MKGATRPSNSQAHHDRFNPRAREGRDTSCTLDLARVTSCFNPRAREGRDGRSTSASWAYSRVSIHAPVKGATRPTDGDAQLGAVSIHAPVKGATRPIIAFWPCVN